MDIRTATPAEIDTELRRLEIRGGDLSRQCLALGRQLTRAEATETGYGTGYRGASSSDIRAQLKQVELDYVATSQAAIPLYEEFVTRGGWSRWYLVDGGHLHYDVSGDRCSRIPTTDHYWMTEFSGQDAAEVIAQAGDRVCTTCFPDAPVAPRPATGRFMTPSEAERAAYTEDKRRKQAAKKAAELRTPDGEPLIVTGDHLRTERAAWNRAMQEAGYLAWYGEATEPDIGGDMDARPALEAILPTLAQVRGTTIQEQRDLLNQRIATKARREGFAVKNIV